MSTQFVFPQDATDPRFRAFFDYWVSRVPAPGVLPGRQHIDPLDIPLQLLPGIVLIDIVPGPQRRRYRFRLIGTAFVDATGADHTGRFVDEVVLHVKHETLAEIFGTMIRTHQPHYWEAPVTMQQRDYMALQRLAVPLARDGANVDMIMGFYVPVVRERPLPAQAVNA